MDDDDAESADGPENTHVVTITRAWFHDADWNQSTSGGIISYTALRGSKNESDHAAKCSRMSYDSGGSRTDARFPKGAIVRVNGNTMHLPNSCWEKGSEQSGESGESTDSGDSGGGDSDGN
jgi:hypothetical protein